MGYAGDTGWLPVGLECTFFSEWSWQHSQLTQEHVMFCMHYNATRLMCICATAHMHIKQNTTLLSDDLNDKMSTGWQGLMGPPSSFEWSVGLCETCVCPGQMVWHVRSQGTLLRWRSTLCWYWRDPVHTEQAVSQLAVQPIINDQVFYLGLLRGENFPKKIPILPPPPKKKKKNMPMDLAIKWHSHESNS